MTVRQSPGLLYLPMPFAADQSWPAVLSGDYVQSSWRPPFGTGKLLIRAAMHHGSFYEDNDFDNTWS